MRKAKSRRRGIQKALKFKSRKDEGFLYSFLFHIGLSKYFTIFGEKCFFFMLFGNSFLGLMQFRRNVHGNYERVSKLRRIAHYVTVCLVGLDCVIRGIRLFIYLAGQDHLDNNSFVCASLFMLAFVGSTMNFSSVINWTDAIDVLRSWPSTLACISGGENSNSLNFDVMTSFIMIGATIIGYGVGFFVAIASFLFKDVPLYMFPTFKSIGLIPRDIAGSDTAWRLVLCPLEVIITSYHLLPATLSTSTLLVGLAVHKSYLQRIRFHDMNSDLVHMHGELKYFM